MGALWPKEKVHAYLKKHKWIYENKKDHKEFKNAKSGIRKKIQKAGSFMAGMILPSISVFIAWGLWSSMFLYNSPTSHGWFQVPELGQLVGPGIKYLLPLLIAINAGKMVYGIRGSAIAAFTTLVIIIGTDSIWAKPEYANIIAINGQSLKGRAPNEIIGAMVVGPLSAWVLKTVEKFYLPKIKVGFEMLVKNFSLAIVAILLGLGLFYAWAWVMFGITWVLTAIIHGFGNNKFIAPLMTIFTEPTRTIFLNNALNHGVLSPIGLEQIEGLKQSGVAHPASIFFMYGGNAGPGLGLLLGYVVWKKGQERTNAVGASLIEFVGGIHEVYYVYVIARPLMIIATIAGAFSSMMVISYADGGTSTIVSPGSVISVIATSPTGYNLGINLAGVFTGTIVTFLVTSLIFLIDKKMNKNDSRAAAGISVNFTDEGIQFNDAPSTSQQLNNQTATTTAVDWSKVKKLYVACDAGMGSSAMAAGLVRKHVKEQNYDLEVHNCAIKDLPDDVDIIVTNEVFASLVQDKWKDKKIYFVKLFLDKKEYEQLYADLAQHVAKKSS